MDLKIRNPYLKGNNEKENFAELIRKVVSEGDLTFEIPSNPFYEKSNLKRIR